MRFRMSCGSRSLQYPCWCWLSFSIFCQCGFHCGYLGIPWKHSMQSSMVFDWGFELATAWFQLLWKIWWTVRFGSRCQRLGWGFWIKSLAVCHWSGPDKRWLFGWCKVFDRQVGPGAVRRVWKFNYDVDHQRLSSRRTSLLDDCCLLN